VIFVNFDAPYVERLRLADPVTEGHFTQYFGELLNLKLRHRLRSMQLVEDVRQETLLRVLRIVRSKGIEHPERLGAFVHSVCNNVLFEQIRSEGRHAPMAEDAPEPADTRVDIEAPVFNEEMRELIDDILDALPAKDRSILRMLFLEETPKEEICRLLNVDGDYLRVLLHRAKSRFRAEFQKRAALQAAARKASADGSPRSSTVARR
jgi:RNA polymerase sigma-70 factor (ECF subfamily)